MSRTVAKSRIGKDGEGHREGQDELQTMKDIISENRGLLNRVLDKIRQHRALGKETVFDAVEKKRKDQEAKKKSA